MQKVLHGGRARGAHDRDGGPRCRHTLAGVVVLLPGHPQGPVVNWSGIGRLLIDNAVQDES